MNTVYLNDKEKEFRTLNYGDVVKCWNDNVECTICNNNIMKEIVVKKMIMVHKIHLFLCCYNCFYKLCEGNEYSCILCYSSQNLLNCSPCELNVCNRCVENHKLEKVTSCALRHCFNCKPNLLWKKRAEAAIVLKVFSSQLNLSRGLMVNESEDEQFVRNYLMEEAKTNTNEINFTKMKDRICLDFLSSSFKMTVTEHISEFTRQTDENNTFSNENISHFIRICEQILENTCSTLTNLKTIFHQKTHLNPVVLSIIKSLLKSEERTINDKVFENVEVDDTLTSSKSNLNPIIKKSIDSTDRDTSSKNISEECLPSLPDSGNMDLDTNTTEECLPSLTESDNMNLDTNTTEECLPSLTESDNMDLDTNITDECLPSLPESDNMDLDTNIPVQSDDETEALQNRSIVTVVLNRLDDSEIKKYLEKKNCNSNSDHSDLDEPLSHPSSFFDDDILSEDDNDEAEKTEEKNQTKLKLNDQKIISKVNHISRRSTEEKSDDEKENDRLACLKNIEKERKPNKSKENHTENSDEEESLLSKNNTNILNDKEDDSNERMDNIINNIDEHEIDTESSLSETNILRPVHDIFKEMKCTTSIPLIELEKSEDESDDSSIKSVVESFLNKRGKEYNRKKKEKEDTDSDVNSLESDSNNSTRHSSNDEDYSDEGKTNKLSPFHMPSLSDSDLSDESVDMKNNNSGVKRHNSSSGDSDSSSKLFKHTPKKRRNTRSAKKSSYILSSHSSSNDSSAESSSDSTNIVRGKKKKRLRVIDSESTNDSDSNSSGKNSSSPLKNGRKNIRSILKKTDLSELTKNALREEDMRRKRIEERQKLYNKIFNLPLEMETCEKLVLDFDPVSKKELVTVHPDLVKMLKHHQIKGVQFLWVSVFESLERAQTTNGSGCILAHCMGLGKTLQIITLVHTLFRYPEIGVKTVLIITPHNTIENWCREFEKWLHDISEQTFLVINLADAKTYEDRQKRIEEWKSEHGVLITSYSQFRSVINYKRINKYPGIKSGLLDPGPDLVVCDEGHLLKNHESLLSKSFQTLKTLRRIVLTGTPMQNNLKEYYCMVQFVMPHLLGTVKEFTNRFINPIKNGQYSDSTSYDVKIMKRKSHVLHKALEKVIQRFDYNVLTPYLPPKHEYVIYLKLSDVQIELYRKYLANFRQPELFTNYTMLYLVWTHPKLLQLYTKRTELNKQKNKNLNKLLQSSFIDDVIISTDVGDTTEENEEDKDEKAMIAGPSRSKSSDYLNWWKPFIKKKEIEIVHPYAKFTMMFSILKECEEIGDKVLLFSQSLNTLDVIQEFLENAEDIEDKGAPYGKSWNEGIDFFRIDGTVSVKTREDCCQKFNDTSNTKLRLLLLSTKAFNLGINLVAANRVIIFDVSWNPSLNVQSIFRVFRFGQNKPCYIYRLVSEGTMEHKIYNRQISKLSMAFRVIDEHQIDRHFNARDQEELYEFEPKTSETNIPNLPKDRLMAELILKHKDIVMNILEHDSLLQNNEDEGLDENDRLAAWDEYERERKGLNVPPPILNPINPYQNNLYIQNPIQLVPHPLGIPLIPGMPPAQPLYTSPEDETLFNTLQNLLPRVPPQQINQMIIQKKNTQHYYTIPK
ncbi:transcriptional regulator ATRX homolog isoform X4 [Adelges cooleyi]|uniref:transcriptional regulator ATRX homolog isoform X4 n=1 Tax=Adelges cooleyi TaxID=133065 RepID=UPI00217FCCF3|nr:transcriptional regulator ATRX homolog isoform X4 [Adelges cooleyi]